MPPPRQDARETPDREQRELYERQSAERGDMERHYRWFAPRRRLEDTVRLAAAAPAARMLEVGCGDGVLLAAVVSALPARPALVTGIELSRGRLARARNRMRESGVVSEFACARAEALPLRADRYDLVLCAEVLEHLIDPWPALAELARVLAPGGRLVISVPVVGWSRWIEARMTGRVRFLDEIEHRREYSAVPLPRCETLDGLRRSLERLGLEIQGEHGVYAFPHRGERMWHALLSRGPLRAPSVALDRAIGASPARRWGRWVLIDAVKRANGIEPATSAAFGAGR